MSGHVLSYVSRDDTVGRMLRFQNGNISRFTLSILQLTSIPIANLTCEHFMEMTKQKFCASLCGSPNIRREAGNLKILITQTRKEFIQLPRISVSNN